MEKENPTSEFKPNTPIEPINELEKFTEVDFQKELFPQRIRTICDHLHELRGTPETMLYFSAMGIVAGLAGNFFKAVNAFTDLEQYPNQYFLGIAESSIGKSTALEPLIQAVRTHENKLYYEYKKTSQKNFPKDDKEILNPCFIVENTTSEALQLKMQETKAPLFSLSTEARQVFNIMGGEYKKQGTDGLSFYNSAWSGETFHCNRINRDEIYIPNAFLSSLWLAQPDVAKDIIKEKSDYFGSGFLARLLAFKAEESECTTPNLKGERDSRIFEEWNSFLLSIIERRTKQEHKIIRATDGAKKIFYDYKKRIDEDKKGIPNLSNVVSKSAEKSARIALLFAIINDSDTITAEMASNACKVIDYSNGVILDFFNLGYMADAEKNKDKILAFFEERNSREIPVSFFRRYKRIEKKEIERATREYPRMFSLKPSENKRGEILVLDRSISLPKKN